MFLLVLRREMFLCSITIIRITGGPHISDIILKLRCWIFYHQRHFLNQVLGFVGDFSKLKDDALNLRYG